jgi:hypothetical protein
MGGEDAHLGLTICWRMDLHPITPSNEKRKLLFERAVASIELGPGLFDRRLAAIVDETVKAPCIDYLKSRIKALGSRPGAAAWKLLLELSRRKVLWANKLICELWPSVLDNALDIIDQELSDRGDLALLDGSILALVRATIIKSGFVRVWARKRPYDLVTLAFDVRFFRPADEYDGFLAVLLRLGGPGSSATLRTVPVRSADLYKGFLRPDVDANSWGPFVIGAAFCRSPSKASLADALELLSRSALTKLLG